MEKVQSDHHDFASYHHHLRIALNWLINMLVERKSVWTETSALSDPRKLETPVFLVFYINPPVRLAFPPSRLSRYSHLPKLTLRTSFKPFNPSIFIFNHARVDHQLSCARCHLFGPFCFCCALYDFQR
jgi:hypothetical protein